MNNLALTVFLHDHPDRPDEDTYTLRELTRFLQQSPELKHQNGTPLYPDLRTWRETHNAQFSAVAGQIRDHYACDILPQLTTHKPQ